ncbi:MAG TPA: tRNA (guanosine(46)-N7)-methyltransferase TrmB [Candidatus Hydrogenedens sp.]|nr:tRNA (guanosine(46)-N7)-methyltransferase TrmB [Candidatus Hydrogenedens sp.]HOL21059.1 tRNA (guanosine(46)-N7)-methyltransferase TrmB [Candidatus Hydrogenedens sp.]
MRIHQHVNPLNKKYQVIPPIPSWSEVYAESFLPLHLDLGSASGKFLLQLAQKNKDWNYLGLEIRQPLVERANRWKDDVGLTNLYFFFGHAHIVLQPLLESLPIGVLHMVSINFPDPWFKRRHHKRRLVTPELVEMLASYLQPHGKVFIQTDVKELSMNICDVFINSPHFQIVDAQTQQNPFGIPTERELSVTRLGRYIYRTILERESENSKEINPHNN